MTEGDNYAAPEGYWRDVGGDDGDGLPTVRDRIVDQLDPEAIHGAAVTARNDGTVYLVVAASTEQSGGDVLDLRTVVVDLDDETVRVSDNGLWVPRDADVAAALTTVSARASNDLRAGDVDAEPVTETAVDDVDVGLLLDREMADDYDPDDDGGDDYTKAPPDEIDGLIARLTEAGISTAERFNRLVFGAKEPFDHDLVGRDGLFGNYGVYATADDPLVLVDVDDPDALDVDLPPTYRVTSPHGGDDRAHHYYRVDDLAAVREAFGKVNFQPTWGDVRAENQYVLGPGCQLDGCDKEWCDRCDDPDGGRYRVVDDRPIHSLDADEFVALLDADPAVTRASDESNATGDADAARDDEGQDTAQPPGGADGGADAAESDDVETVACEFCHDEIPRSAAVEYASDGDAVAWVCEGGCS